MKVSEGAEAFVTACRLSDRKGFREYMRSHGIGQVDPGVLRTARREYARSPILLDPRVHRISTETLLHARGPQATLTAGTVWPHICSTRDGVMARGALEDFAEGFRKWAMLVHPKGEGQVYNPTTTSDGHRCNASTRSVHALILDCDGTGEWTDLLAMLEGAGFAFIAHRSGGHTPTVPKWRLLLPLASPFPIESPQSVAAWRRAYAHARTALGAIALLRGPGFDPATDAPSHAWYPGYRRSTSAPPPEIRARTGASLDLLALIASLPKVDAPTKVKQVVSAPRRPTPAAPTDRVPVSNLERAFVAAGLAGAAFGDGKRAVRCPWNHLHSDPLPDGAAPTSSTVLFPPSRWNPGGTFYCSHSSCGVKPYVEVLAMLPPVAAQKKNAVPPSPSPPGPPQPARGWRQQNLRQPRSVPRGVPRLRSL